MVFINPKAKVTPSDINRMIDDLCNGFALTCICGFGLWATTKELFRRIGMMDERFIGGEFEDNDLTIRIKKFNAAVSWRYEADKYPFTFLHYRPYLRGLSKTTYRMKWHIVNGLYHRTDCIPGEKSLPPKIQNSPREDIAKSWNTWDKSVCVGYSQVFNEADAALFSDKIARSTKFKQKSKLTFERYSNEDLMQITFNCDSQTDIYVVIVNALPVEKEATEYYIDRMIGSNTWHRFEFKEGLYDIRVYHQGKIILNNSFYQFPDKLEYDLGLTITNYETI